MLQEPWISVNNLLAVRLDNIGDVIMLGPALRAIKENLPSAKVTLLAGPGGAQAAGLLPWIDEVIAWRTVWQDLGRLGFDPEREMKLIETLRVRKFDAAILFTSFSQTPHAAGYVCYLAGIPLRLGESKEFGGTVLSHELRSRPDEIHQVERNLGLLEHVGFEVRHRNLSIHIPEAAQVSVREKLAAQGLGPGTPYVLLSPWASCQARTYPTDRCAIAGRLIHRSTGLPIIVNGTVQDIEHGRAVVEAIGSGAVSLIGQTNLGELAALVAGSKLVLTNNTATLHLADATGVPMVVTYSGTEYESQWRPRQALSRLLRVPTPCSPCYQFRCPYNLECLEISPEQVAQAALEVMESNGGPAATPDRAIQPLRDREIGEDGYTSVSPGPRAANWVLPEEIRKIVIFRALFLGDFLCAVPALQALRERFPRAEVTLIGLPWTQQVLDRFSFVDRFLVFPGWLGIQEMTYEPARTEKFLAEARAYGYDLAVQMHGSGEVSNEFVAALGARFSVGYYKQKTDSKGQAAEGAGILQRAPTARCPLSYGLPFNSGEHEVLRWVRLMERLGAKGSFKEVKPVFPLRPADVAEAERLLGSRLESGRPLIGIHAGAKDPARRWPAGQFARLARRLVAELGAQIVLTGGPDEKEWVDRVAEWTRAPALNLAGQTTLGGLAALIARLDLLITNDSGPSHLAWAFGTPSVVLFGPTDPARWAPLDTLRHRVVYKPGGLHRIPGEDVWHEARQLILKHGTVPRDCIPDEFR